MLSAELLKRRGVRSVVWFHTDHWEPWGVGVNDASVRSIANFTDQSRGSPFARKATLFYLDGRNYLLTCPPAMNSVDDPHVTVPGDVAALILRSDDENRQAREIIGELRAATEVDFQVHLHHEQFVLNDGEWNDFHRVLKMHTNPALDEQRVRLLLRLALETTRRDTGKALDRWAFIHGMWALNGSDREVCQIDNEIQVLMEYGCWGDFTFPAGRPDCDPTIRMQPYTIKPFPAEKCYDRPEGDPRLVDVGAGAIRKDRFLIWNCRAGYDVCSLDYYNESSTARLDDSEHLVASWVRACPVIDDVLYIKTHAHSMHWFYHEPGHWIPLAHPAIRAGFDLLQRACDRAGAELVACSVDEVFERLRQVDSRGGVVPERPASATLPLADEPIVIAASGDARAPEADTPEVNVVALNDFAVAVLRPWTETSDERRQAASEFYLGKLAAGHLLDLSDVSVANYAARHFDKSTKFFELGCGFGELSILLSLNGFDTVGFESATGRYQGARGLVDALTARGVDLSNLMLVEGVFPSELRLDQLDGRGERVLVSNNLTSGYIGKNFTFVRRSLRLFDHLMINISRFDRVRDASDEQQCLIEQIELLGFAEVRAVLRYQEVDVRHFARRPETQARRAAAPDPEPATRTMEPA